MKSTYLWSHGPFVSSLPHERVKHRLFEGKKDEIDEIAVFELENGKFLFIRFYGTKTNLDLGYTDVEEFDTLNEAKNVYDLMFSGEKDDKEE